MFKWIVLTRGKAVNTIQQTSGGASMRKRQSYFPLVNGDTQKHLALFTIAIAKGQRQSLFGLAIIVESFTTTTLVFYKSFQAENRVQARLQILRKLLLRITQQGIQGICLQTLDKAWRSLLSAAHAINWRFQPCWQDSVC